jgi:1,4-alpha-glucan branching enzyme
MKKNWPGKLILILLCSVSSSWASSATWRDSFFTDDTPYYHKLHSKGFTQRFRINASECNQVSSAEIMFKNNPSSDNVSFRIMRDSELRKWPKLYGIEESQFCWWQAKVNNISLATPKKNLFAIKFTERAERNKNYYYSGIRDSLLPQKRIHSSPIITWITPGTLGANVVSGGGVYFKVWEPTVERVDLFIKDYNGHNPFPMIAIDNNIEEGTVHHLYLPQVKKGHLYHYKFVKNGAYESLEVANFHIKSEVKIDPMAYELEYERKGGKFNGYIEPWGKVAQNHEYNWKFDAPVSNLERRNKDNWVIYQLWPLTFNPPKNGRKYTQGTFKTVIDKIDYISDLGVTAVELLPIHEARFYASWGYALDSLRLIEKTLGTPKDVKLMVDELHKRKIRVILDVVINHVNNQLLREPLTQTVHNSKYYEGNTLWGPRPRYQNIYVRKWMADSLIALIRDYHIDGLRFDMVETIYEDNPAGYTFLQELNKLITLVHPGFNITAEQLPDNVWATYPLKENGLGFTAQWNDKFKNFFELEFDDYRSYSSSKINLGVLKAAMIGYSDHIGANGEYHFGSPKRTVNYLGSHDFVGNKDPLIRIVSDYESYEYEEESFFVRIRPLTDPDRPFEKFRLIHNQFTHSLTRLAYGILFTKPGQVLFYQGEELAQDLNIENEWSFLASENNNTTPTKDINIDRYVGAHKMPWEYLNPTADGPLNFLEDHERKLFSGHLKFFKDLIKFRKTYHGINDGNATNVQTHYNDRVITYQITAGKHEFYVVANMGPAVADGQIFFPGPSNTWWEEVVNSTSKVYGGNTFHYQNIISNMGGRVNNIRLGQNSFSIFERKGKAKISMPLFLRGNFNNWGARTQDLLKVASDHGNIYVTELLIEKEGTYQFKLGSENWDIELGDSGEKDFFSSMILKDDQSGSLSYIPNKKNFEVHLFPGEYRFLFNIESFKYNFFVIE